MRRPAERDPADDPFYTPPPPEPSVNRFFAILTSDGGVLMLLGALLPWSDGWNAPWSDRWRAVGGPWGARVAAVMGLMAAVLGLLALVARTGRVVLQVHVIVAGILGLFVFANGIYELRATFAGQPIRLGLWLVLLGSILTLVGGARLYSGHGD